jgi:site-specific DNA-methyltransferase (adenine-specific)
MQATLFDIVDRSEAHSKTHDVRRRESAPSALDRLGAYELDAVHLADCVEAMKRIPSHSVDVAIADPPYNLSKGGVWKWDNSVRLPGFGGDWCKVMAKWDDMPLAEYFTFTLAWLSELKRLVRPTGSLWVHGTYHNIGLINFVLQLLEVEIINEVVWFKRNSFPNLSGRRLTASHETILWAHTGGPKKRRYYFAYEHSKRMACAGDSLKEHGKQMRTVWDIPNNKKREEIEFGKHPTQKPVRLLIRMLELSAKPGGILLVPFAGAGSDCVAAKSLGMRFLAFENDPEYITICQKRLMAKGPSANVTASSGPIQGETELCKGGNLAVARRAQTIPSLIKWTGSKRSQAAAIAAFMPPYRRYFEPFLGGGALLYLAGVPGSVAGDSYGPLICLWKLIQTDPERVVSDYELKWAALKTELDALNQGELKRGEAIPQTYYLYRRRFNEKKDPLDLNFLMRTCVNGIVRFNDQGEFNNSFHLSRAGMEPRRFRAVVDAWHPVIQGVEFLCCDYAEMVAGAEKEDFVYFDPPYAASHQRYAADLDLERFFGILEMLNARGVKWALSFDGRRGSRDLTHPVDQSLFKRQLSLASGNSPVNKVLNGPIEPVEESLYLNY